MVYRIDIAGTGSSGGAVMEKSFNSLGVFGSVVSGVSNGLATASKSSLGKNRFGPVSRSLRATTLLVLLTAGLSLSGVSPVSAETCPNEAARKEQNSHLSDCRAYELVSPPIKNAADVLAMSDHTRAADNGNAVQFASLTGFGDVRSIPVAAEYVARRTGAGGMNGWATHAITPAQAALSFSDNTINALQPHYAGELSPNLERGIFLSKTPLTSDPLVASVPNIYLRTDLLSSGAGTYDLLSACPLCVDPLPGDAQSWQPAVAGASRDLGSVLFESKHNLATGASGTDPKAYVSTHGQVTLAGILPGGAPADSSGAGMGAIADAATPVLFPMTHPITEDGSRVAFTSPIAADSNGCAGVCDLYVRDFGDPATTLDDTTVQVSASENTQGVPTPAPAIFQGASSGVGPAGERTPWRIFFTSAASLTSDEAPSDSSNDLFMYDASQPDASPSNLTRISVGSAGSGAVQGVIGVSDRGDYAYFVANAQLESGQPDVCSINSCIFVWHDGDVHWVGEVNTGPERDILLTTTNENLQPRAARVTPDGTHLIFRSQGTDGLTGYDHGDCPFDPLTGSPNVGCAEIYVYDATANGGAGQLKCASCNPTGAPATAHANIVSRIAYSAATPTTHLTRAISDDGRYVFFTTGERLVPADLNGSVEDVYQYDTVNDQVSLISSGTSISGSYFLDASADGRDVFFTTRSKLVGWDTDNNQDLYDARTGGGFPEPPPTPAACAGDGCQGPQTLPPSLTTPGSSTLLSVGNVKPVSKKVSKPLSKAQKLKKALKACKSKRSKAKRKKCKSAARKRFSKSGGSK